ncbi:MAG: GNAT family N-acetyltransferase [Prevotella sp.]|nr:GNAT family N-acetyltransferase [Prevotella sp.]
MFEIRRYTPEKAGEWNRFVQQSKNGTFLFDRQYMDYHADRFHDHSVMCYLKGKLYALLPANADDGILYSHQGLTYGGLVMDDKATAANTVKLFHAINDYYRGEGIRRIIYRPTPWIYHRIPAEEDLFAIYNECRGQMTAKEISSCIVIPHPTKWSTLRNRCVKKAERHGITVRMTDDYEAFWQILSQNLFHKYGLRPVHTIEEIRLLQSRFPDNIQLVGAYHDGRLIGGMLLYLTPLVIHSQYIAADEKGKQTGAIDLIMHHLLHEMTHRQVFFDFGKSTEEHGDKLNENLIHQKEGFGGRGVCYDTYEWTL